MADQDKKSFYVVSFGGDRYAGDTLEEAIDLASVTRDNARGTHTGYWGIIEANDPCTARLWGTTDNWVEFNCIPH